MQDECLEATMQGWNAHRVVHNVWYCTLSVHMNQVDMLPCRHVIVCHTSLMEQLHLA